MALDTGFAALAAFATILPAHQVNRRRVVLVQDGVIKHDILLWRRHYLIPDIVPDTNLPH
jgi:hypothetical protein